MAAAQVDALDEQRVEGHMNAVVAKAGRVDVSFNAVGISQQGWKDVQGAALLGLSPERFGLPIATYTRSNSPELLPTGR